MVSVTVHGQQGAPGANGAAKPADKKLAETLDARERIIKVRKLGPLDRMRLFKVLGPDLSKNEQYLGHAFIAASVTSIDGSEEQFPASEKQIEAMVARLDDDGLTAAALCYKENFGTPELSEQDPVAIKN